jgi:hypothetical protein
MGVTTKEKYVPFLILAITNQLAKFMAHPNMLGPGKTNYCNL